MPKSYSRINKMGNNNFEEELGLISSDYIRGYAYKNGSSIYDFMDKYDIGKSAFGSLMDSAATGKNDSSQIICHHLFYDFHLSQITYCHS